MEGLVAGEDALGVGAVFPRRGFQHNAVYTMMLYAEVATQQEAQQPIQCELLHHKINTILTSEGLPCRLQQVPRWSVPQQ